MPRGDVCKSRSCVFEVFEKSEIYQSRTPASKFNPIDVSTERFTSKALWPIVDYVEEK